jgi:hypothetical protein
VRVTVFPVVIVTGDAGCVHHAKVHCLLADLANGTARSPADDGIGLIRLKP